MKFSKISLSVALMVAMFSCKPKADNYTVYFNDATLYCKTVKKLNDVVMENNFPPMIGSRNYAYANIAAYQCIAAGDNNYNSLSGQIKHLPETPKPQANQKVNFNLAALLAFTKVGNAVTFPEGSMMSYYDELTHAADSLGMPDEMLKSTIAYADTVVASILKWSKKDNYAQTRSASKYTVSDSIGRWIPTPPMYASAVEPHWMEIRPFVIDTLSKFLPEAPLPFDVTDKSSKYYKEVMAIKNAGDSLTDEQKHIAEFWDDLNTKMNVSGHAMFLSKKFSPPGHWMNIVSIACQKDKADFSKTVSAFALTSISLFDAFIQCWNVKYMYNTVRPETVINKYMDANWRPYLQTPPFPEYTCGHSTISSAAAEALTKVFGDNFAYTDDSEMEFGIKNRSFISFRQAADENNWARFYGGIHFHSSCLVSTKQGKQVGEFIVNKIKLKK